MDSRSISKSYDAFYYAHSCGDQPYERNDAWLSFFSSVADRIVSGFHPSFVLDAGCALGLLVESLRDRGVSAFGIDISEYAIENVRSDIRPFCWTGSLTDAFPQRYDLIVCIEVLEHLSAQEGERAIANLCSHSDDILFSSTPFDYKEATHLNVRPPDYWAEAFARHGFYRDVDFDTTFLTPWAVRFRNTRETPSRLVAAYERRLWQLEKDNQARREMTIEQRNELANKQQLLDSLYSQVHGLNLQINEHARAVRDLSAGLEQKEKDAQILNAHIETLSGQNRLLVSQLREKEHLLKNAFSNVTELSAKLSEREREARSLSVQLAEKERMAQMLSAQATAQKEALKATTAHLENIEAELEKIKRSFGWQMLSRYGRFKYRYLMPIYRTLKLAPREAAPAPEAQASAAQAVAAQQAAAPDVFPVMEVAQPPRLQAHQASVEIIVCVHNALDDVKRCLDSVVRYSRAPYRLVIVDDGSEQQTRDYLSRFATSQGAKLIRNEKARGYTYAANQALRESDSDYVILLNSDTEVTPDWLDRMVACGESDPRIAMVGPLSNTASWQSIPEIFEGQDWAKNPLPDSLNVADMGRVVAHNSSRLYPRIPFLNGFCLMLKREVIDEIGYFDEETFGEGYGEENDYCIKVCKAGWQIAVADDVYVHHSQSRSYSHERRKQLVERSDLVLVARHGQQILSDGVTVCRYDRALEGVRARSRVMIERREFLEKGKSKWEGKRVLFILPLLDPAGGANVILQEAAAMQGMGVDVRILTLTERRARFERIYADSSIPLVDVERETHIPGLFSGYDAVVAAMSGTVEWMNPLTPISRLPIRGYYIQDFEPRFFPEDSEAFRTAWNSYTLFPDLVRVTKTEWNRDIIKKEIGVESFVIGPSVDIDLYRPRRRRDAQWPARPLRIAAMIRPSTPRRNPKLTMEVLKEIHSIHGSNLEIILFGCTSDDPAFQSLPRDFAWRNAGVLSRPQLAFLLNEIDIFADFSSFQAMGLTALESMACGAAVVVPQNGGSTSFARHDENSIIVDTGSQQACLAALQRLIMDAKLRAEIQRQALYDVCQYFPEKAALNILTALFQDKD